MTNDNEAASLWLGPIPPMLHDMAIAAFEAGDAGGFLCRASNEDGLELVRQNASVFQKRGIYEAALLVAYTSTRTNNARWPTDELARLFEMADRAKLRAAGQPLPGPGPFTIYRGVAGSGSARRVRGYSWTGSIEMAWWFADRSAKLATLKDPAVFQATVEADAVLAYVHEKGRSESEFIVDLPPSVKPRRVDREQGAA